MRPLSCLIVMAFLPFLSFAQKQGATGKGNTVAKTPNPIGQNLSRTYGLGGKQPVQVSEYIPQVFQDRAGHYWFATNGDGVCRYDGQSFVYFTQKQGLAGNVVRAMLQDKAGALWFATDGGLSRYDGKAFANFTMADGLPDNEVWRLLLDRRGDIWCSTTRGVCRFNGKAFQAFALPAVDLRTLPRDAFPSSRLVWHMLQDRAGNIWFATNGGGAYRYDGNTLTSFKVQNGLCHNVVQWILEDRQGTMWFATMDGVSRYDGKAFTTYTTREGLGAAGVWTMLEDRKGNLWFGTSGGGATRFDGKTFTTFKETLGLTRNHIQSILEDRDGQLWFGFSGGVFRFDGGSFVNVPKDCSGQVCARTPGK